MTPTQPEYLTDLTAAYGAPSRQGFGSAVFREILQDTGDVTNAALSKYRYVVGNPWERYGEQAGLEAWRQIYARETAAHPNIVIELRGIADPDTRRSLPMILEGIERAEVARAALSAAFDDLAVTELRVFNLGDGEAMSGLLVAGRRGTTGESTFLVFLYD